MDKKAADSFSSDPVFGTLFSKFFLTGFASLAIPCFALAALCWSGLSFAASVDQPLLFKRCFSHLTQKFLRPGHPLLQQVKNGDLSALEACSAVLKSAKWDESGRTDSEHPDGVAVLRTFHQLHQSFFEDRAIPVIQNNVRHQATKQIFDPAAPSYYWTRALFASDFDLSSVLNGSSNLRAIRANQNPAKGYGKIRGKPVEKDRFVFGDSLKFASRGKLLGVAKTGKNVWPFGYARANGDYKEGRVVTTPHYGGGVLGSAVYLLKTVSEEAGFKANGAVQMPRKWSRAVFKDLLCRELPVVRAQDAKSSVRANSEIPFRKSSGCVRCHVSMDQAAALLRGFRYRNLGGGNTVPQLGGNFVTLIKPVAGLAPETSWPEAVDPDYFKRPANGHFYFRTSQGELVDKKISSLKQLGQTLSSLQDFYSCAASRYYAYFTGTKVQLADAGDPDTPKLSNKDQLALKKVIELGGSLQKHQSLEQLILEILQSDEYAVGLPGRS